MKKELMITAKTVEEAKAKAAAEFGVAEEEIEFTVVEEAKRGFFGIGATDAKVQAVYTVKGADIALEFIRKMIADMELEGLTVAMKPGSNDDVVC